MACPVNTSGLRSFTMTESQFPTDFYNIPLRASDSLP